MNIENFLNKEDAALFDFTDDCTENAEYHQEKGWAKYIVSHMPNPPAEIAYPKAEAIILENRTRYGYIQNAKNSTLLQSIFRKLYPDILAQDFMINRGLICSSTMINVPLTMFLQEKLHETIIRKYGAQRKASIRLCIQLYYEQDQAFNRMLCSTEGQALLKLIELENALGNFILVPQGVEAQKGDYYWNLQKIQCFFEARATDCSDETKDIIETLPNSNYFKWLNSFKSFEDFINKNYLNDFIDLNGQPIELCEGHHSEEFFKTAAKLIELRGKRMIEALKAAV